jgi:putative FmdB family regulatory protein
VPFYEYRCRSCETRFELLRPSVEADAPATCPAGHTDARRLLSVFAAGGRAAGASTEGAGFGSGRGGGCCGGSCGCG